jgi:DNA repair photolyase
MISSATDAYQPAELKFELTRKCVKILQKYNIPYYVFTKSTLISRDIELHKQYKDSCFLVWSITTCDEHKRRIIEPGTPPADAMFKIIKRCSEAGIRCAVNIDPIIPLITDSFDDIEILLDNCLKLGVCYIFGATLRLRADIWERMKIIFKMLNKDGKEEEYKEKIKEYKRLYHFEEPFNQRYNLDVDKNYSNTILNNLNEAVIKRNMYFDFPHLIVSHSRSNRRFIETNKSSKSIDNSKQLSLMDYI